MGSAHGKECCSPRRHQRKAGQAASEEDSGSQGIPRSRPHSVHEALLRERDPFENVTDFFEIMDCIGSGALSKVYKIQKKYDKIGGSSREMNVRRPVTPPHNKQPPPRKRFFRMPSVGSHSSTGSSAKHLSGEGSADASSTSLAVWSSMESLALDAPATPQHARSMAGADTLVLNDTLLPSPNQCPVPKLEMYFALKKIDLAVVPADKIDQLKNEVEILKTLDHKNIIKAYETFTATNKLMIVMELCTGGDLVGTC
jgi:serine/threonine protein kinase